MIRKLDVSAKIIKDSRGEDTIEVSVLGYKASAPAGKSTGKHETPPYYKSLQWCVDFINMIYERDLIRFQPSPYREFSDLIKIEYLMKRPFSGDFKPAFNNAKQLGANALFALESALLKAIAGDKKKELWQVINPKAKKMPIPIGNAIGGGLHSHHESHPTFQEFLIIPKEKTAKKNVEAMKEVYKKLGKLLKSKSVNDEGAWETGKNEEEILEILREFKEVNIGVDVAASSFYDKSYEYQSKELNRDAQIAYINSLISEYNLLYVEDPLEEEDFEGFSKIRKKNLIVGDDLTATQIERLKQAIKHKSINAMIIKPNQNGSLLELKEIFDICKKNRITTILSHRSGETMDDALADYAVGFGADYIKCGIATPWREVKLNRLIEIERQI
ncbi:hypothetical protein KW805_03505 [Candidatus Pacearchaeota archaeon]|nr:hypothetical protein [Candidatus Pacearchaeota archaeon]